MYKIPEKLLEYFGWLFWGMGLAYTKADVFILDPFLSGIANIAWRNCGAFIR